MAFITTDEVVERVADLMRERLEKRKAELKPRAPANTKPVRKWLLQEWDWPNIGSGDLPKGVVDLDERRSVRAEQDTGEEATFSISISIYFSEVVHKANARKWAAAYGDAILYALMMEAHGKRPKDDTVLPGWFRIWPASMVPGETEKHGLFGVEVKATVIIDSSFSAAE